MRSGAYKIRVVTGLRGLADRAEAVSPDVYIDLVKALPVAADSRAAQRALLKELASAKAASRALVQRIRTIADRVEQFPLDETRKTIARRL